MSTNGLVGFVIDGKVKLSYNHYDSYPSGLGSDVLTWLKLTMLDTDALADLARNVRVISPRAELSHEEDKATRYSQGDPIKILQVGMLIDSSNFARDSLTCEWVYIVDFDARELQVYEGMQTMPHNKGRFAHLTPSHPEPIDSLTYYPVALAASWSLDQLPTFDDMDDLDRRRKLANR